MTDKEQKKAAKQFAEFWKDKGYEKGQSQMFWTSLLEEVYGVANIKDFIEFEDQVMMDKSTGFIDVYIPSTKVLIEQKSIEKDGPEVPSGLEPRQSGGGGEVQRGQRNLRNSL